MRFAVKKLGFGRRGNPVFLHQIFQRALSAASFNHGAAMGPCPIAPRTQAPMTRALPPTPPPACPRARQNDCTRASQPGRRASRVNALLLPEVTACRVQVRYTRQEVHFPSEPLKLATRAASYTTSLHASHTQSRCSHTSPAEATSHWLEVTCATRSHTSPAVVGLRPGQHFAGRQTPWRTTNDSLNRLAL